MKYFGTKNLSGIDLDKMQISPSQYATETGKRKPYHLQYVANCKATKTLDKKKLNYLKKEVKK